MTRVRPDIPPAFWSDLAEEIRSLVDSQELVGRLVPIYQAHFTAEEVRQLIAFYQTPVGQKFIAELPQLQREAAQVGQQWGTELGRRLGTVVAQRMAEKGYRPEPPPPQPPQPSVPPPKL